MSDSCTIISRIETVFRLELAPEVAADHEWETFHDSNGSRETPSFVYITRIQGLCKEGFVALGAKLHLATINIEVGQCRHSMYLEKSPRSPWWTGNDKAATCQRTQDAELKFHVRLLYSHISFTSVVGPERIT